MRKTMTEKVLKIIWEAVAASTMAMSPSYGLRKYYRRYHEGEFAKALYNLKEYGFLEEIEIKGEKWLKVTPKGRLKLIKKKLQGEWDGFWRIIAFDIPETRKKTRDIFRSKLTELNCRPIQKSVWITPTDITMELEDLIELLDLENNVDYFISKALTNEEKYLEIFKINSLNENPAGDRRGWVWSK